jgi:hypothetical protein
VLFGGPRESLEPYSGDEEAKNRVTLLQSTRLDAQHEFKTACFPGIFRSSKITLPTPMGYITPRTGTPGSLSGISNSGYASVGLPFHDRSNSPASSFASVEQPGVKSWAKLAQAVAPLPQTSAIPRAPEEPAQRHNKKGQRIDPPILGDWREIQRVKAIKMCNMHYLHPDGCKFSAEYCNHRHDYKPTAAEVKLLRSVSRETACRHGIGCNEDVCVYGHRWCVFCDELSMVLAAHSLTDYLAHTPLRPRAPCAVCGASAERSADSRRRCMRFRSPLLPGSLTILGGPKIEAVRRMR